MATIAGAEIIMNLSNRQTGRTTKQLRNVPLNGVFIWCNNNLVYPRCLASHIGRMDIIIVGPDWLDSDKWRGIKLPGTDIDHAARLTDHQLDNYLILQSKC